MATSETNAELCELKSEWYCCSFSRFVVFYCNFRSCMYSGNAVCSSVRSGTWSWTQGCHFKNIAIIPTQQPPVLLEMLLYRLYSLVSTHRGSIWINKLWLYFTDCSWPKLQCRCRCVAMLDFLLPPRWNVWISRASDVVLMCFCSPLSKDCSMLIDFYMKMLSYSTV